MAKIELKKNNYEVTGRMMLFDYDADVWLTKVQLSKNGIDFIDAIAFSQLTAMFDLTEWDNGDYNDCILRGYYDDISIFTNVENIIMNEKNTAELKVFLDRASSNNITITLNTENTSIATIDKTSLTFTKENYNVAQTVVVTGVYNTDDKDFSTNLSLSIAGAVVKTVLVTVKNIDIKYGEMSITKTSLSINEGSSNTVGVKLASKPTNDQYVTITKNNGNVTLDKEILVFTPNNYNITQNITITGVYDDSTSDKASIITFSSEEVTSKTLNISVINTDSYGEIVLNTSSLSFNEGSSSSFTVKLDKAPSKNQVVTITSDKGITLNKTSLTFTSSNYNVAQTVTITSTEDKASYADKAITITLTSPKVSEKTINVDLKNITQSPYANVITNVSSITVDEGSTFTLSVKLDKAPPQNQIVTISNSNGFITLNKASLTFTPSNYDTYQTVVVTGMRDTSSFVDKTSVITLSSSNGDININTTIKNVDIKTYNITKKYTNCSDSNSVTTVNEKTTYKNTISANQHCEIQNIQVTMGGNDITSSVVSNGVINIPSVTGDIVITATAIILDIIVTPTMTKGYVSKDGMVFSTGVHMRSDYIEIGDYSSLQLTLTDISGVNDYSIRNFVTFDNNYNLVEGITVGNSVYNYEIPSNAQYLVFDVPVVNSLDVDLNNLKATIQFFE